MKKTYEELEILFQALGDRTRLRLLNLMSAGEVCVCFFVEALDEPQPKISRHLAFLRKAGLVSARRDAKWMHYSVAMPAHDHRHVLELGFRSFLIGIVHGLAGTGALMLL